MAPGFYFGKSHWDDIPQQLGLTAEDDGFLRGQWRGFPVTAHFYNRFDRSTEDYYHYTDVNLRFDPPLGVGGTEVENLVLEPELVLEVSKKCKEMGMTVTIGDGGFFGTWNGYEGTAVRYRAVFDLFAWAAAIILQRRAQHPPAWIVALGESWPSLAKGWGLALDVARAKMTGSVRGLPTSVVVQSHYRGRMTSVEVAVPLPAGFELQLKKQDGDGFFDRLFRGQDVVVGDPAFDGAFVIKGKPEELVRAALTPAARQQILGLSYAGVAITLEDGRLSALAKGVLTDREQLDQLMKAAYSAAVALAPNAAPNAPPAPYR